MFGIAGRYAKHREAFFTLRRTGMGKKPTNTYPQSGNTRT
jgi:hypothetical protein